MSSGSDPAVVVLEDGCLECGDKDEVEGLQWVDDTGTERTMCVTCAAEEDVHYEPEVQEKEESGYEDEGDEETGLPVTKEEEETLES